MEYDEARSIMATHKANVLKANGKVGSLATDRKKLKFRTFLYRKESPADDIDETYEIHYFHTPIITLYSHKVVLNDGGWFSHSTHKRLNEYMPRGFRVHGSKPHWYHSTVGFVRTPAGTAPYNMPQSFLYNGLPADDTSPSIEAGVCFNLIPTYVDRLLALVFNRANPAMIDIPVTDDKHVLGDHLWPLEVLKKMLFRPIILRHAAEQQGVHGTLAELKLGLAGFNVDVIVEMLLKEGAHVFTKREEVKRVEAMLRLDTQIPILRRQALRSLLRRTLINFLVTELGFKDQEWNRRNAS
jgi:hypothetical protein